MIMPPGNECLVCGARFETSEVSQTRCPECRAKGRDVRRKIVVEIDNLTEPQVEAVKDMLRTWQDLGVPVENLSGLPDSAVPRIAPPPGGSFSNVSFHDTREYLARLRELENVPSRIDIPTGDHAEVCASHDYWCPHCRRSFVDVDYTDDLKDCPMCGYPVERQTCDCRTAPPKPGMEALRESLRVDLAGGRDQSAVALFEQNYGGLELLQAAHGMTEEDARRILREFQEQWEGLLGGEIE